MRGAQIYDLMHAAAAAKYGASILMTLHAAGFRGLAQEIEIRSP
jgi:hypothetical protein